VIKLKMAWGEDPNCHVASLCAVCGSQPSKALVRAAAETYTADELDRSLPMQDG
jgi:hypothetical protein